MKSFQSKKYRLVRIDTKGGGMLWGVLTHDEVKYVKEGGIA